MFVRLTSTQGLTIGQFNRFNVKYSVEHSLNKDLVYVADAPLCRGQQTDVYGVGRSEQTTITCRVEADPPVTRYRWAFNSTGEFINIPR